MLKIDNNIHKFMFFFADAQYGHVDSMQAGYFQWVLMIFYFNGCCRLHPVKYFRNGASLVSRKRTGSLESLGTRLEWSLCQRNY